MGFLPIETGIVEKLRAIPTLVDVIEDRVHPVHRPQGGKLPAIVYWRTGTEPPSTTTPTCGPTELTIMLHILAATYIQAKDVANEIRLWIDYDRIRTAAMHNRGIRRIDERDILEVPQSGKSEPVYGVEMVLRVWVNETAPLQ